MTSSRIAGLTVVLSQNNDNQTRCVDIFKRADGSFGYEEYRRDPEDNRGWYPIGGYAARSFVSSTAAETHAKAYIDWFRAIHRPQPGTATHSRE